MIQSNCDRRERLRRPELIEQVTTINLAALIAGARRSADKAGAPVFLMPGDPRYAGIRRKLQEIRDQETKRLEKAITAARVAVRQRITENVMISRRFTLYHRFVRVPDYAVRSSVRCGACASFCASRARSTTFVLGPCCGSKDG